MTAASAPTEAQVPLWLKATPEDFGVTDVNAPIASSNSVNSHELCSLFNAAAEAAGEAQRSSEARVYCMLGAICSFYFKPENSSEPYSPMMRLEDGRRSAQPSDFVGEPSIVVRDQFQRVTNPMLRARLSDLVWLLDRKQHAAGSAAVEAYCDIVESVVDDTASLDREKADEHSHEIPEFLRRALQVGKAIGWDKSAVIRARALVARLRVSALGVNRSLSFLRLSGLDLDYEISDPALIASEAEGLAGSTDPDSRHSLMHVAARAYRAAKNTEAREVCLLAAAEALVAVADAQKSSAMGETHWLEKAIAEMRRLPAAKERVLALKHRLLDSQARILDEMRTFSHSEDISDVIERSRSAVTGKPLANALRTLATCSRSQEPLVLE